MARMEGERTIRICIFDTVDGNPVSPAAVPLSLLKEFAKDAEDLIRGSEAESTGPIVVSIDAGSLELNPISSVPDSFYRDIAFLESHTDVSAIDQKRGEVILRWQRNASKCPGRRYSMIDSKHGHAVVISKSTRYFERDASRWVRVRRRILGDVVSMGGATRSNIHIRTKDGLVVVQSNNELLAEEKENHLYKKCLITIIGEENLDTGELRQVKLVRFEPYAPALREDITNRMRASGERAWGGVDSVEWTRKNRGD